MPEPHAADSGLPVTSTFDFMNAHTAIAASFASGLIVTGLSYISKRSREQPLRGLLLFVGIVIFPLAYYFFATAFPDLDRKWFFGLSVALGATFGNLAGDLLYKKKDRTNRYTRTIHSAALSGESKYD